MVYKIFIFALLAILGFILATLGLISFPVFHNINYFWPAAVVQAVGSILFGWVGVIAGTVFPIFSNFVTDSSYQSVILFTPANFIQSCLPLLILKKLRPNLVLKGTKDFILFSILVALIPQLIGGFISSSLLFLLGELTTASDFSKMLLLWIFDSVPWIILFGYPLLKIFVPILKESGYLYSLNKQ
ncbi:MAG: hypothetical protein ABIA04_09670 [Pseudomonadota bacterium]